MDRLLFVDVETTSLEEARIVQISMTVQSDNVVRRFSGLFRPPCPITFEAMAVHHITEAMIAEEKAFNGSERQSCLRAWLSSDDNFTLVAHNAKFDVLVLEREGVPVPRFICTMRVAMDLFPDYPHHGLQYLRYREGLEVDLHDRPPHDALADVLVLEALYMHLAAKLRDRDGIAEEEIVPRMLSITGEPVILRRFKFGKHKGETFEEVRNSDPSYLRWIVDKSDLDEDVKRTAVHWLKRT